MLTLLFAGAFADVCAGRRLNARGQQHFTVESPHFRIHYHRGLEHLTPRVAAKLEELYQIYSETYHIVLPAKTDVVLYESEIPDAFAYPNFNFIYIGVHDYEFNLRGSSDWFDDVLTHEYAHIVSMWTGLKFAPAVPEVQVGFFSQYNAATRFEGLHVLPSQSMPIWFIEGIAQYESKRRGSDRWDSHRDMILRTLTLSDNMLSWPNMQVFAGRGDDFEKVYNHGFSLVMYISETYGYDRIVSILRENARVGRLSFDGSVRAVLGISAKQLYDDWQEWLGRRYRDQIREIGEQVFGRKINDKGYDNRHPRFSPDGSRIYFISNADNDYSLRSLYSYNLSDTVDDKRRIRYEMPISSQYDIHAPSGRIVYVSMKSRRSYQEPRMGGHRLFDLFVDTLPPERPRFFRRKTERQLTEGKSVFAAAWSPAGDKLVCAVRKLDRFFIAVVDTSGENMRIVYPRTGVSAEEFFRSARLPEGSDSLSFGTIFSLVWSPDGNRIAVDYIDGVNRKIGIYDTLQGTFTVFNDTDEYDQRNPSFNRDGSVLYFSSDKTGIFNVYRYSFRTGHLQRLTNVSGGAFHPAVCDEERRLVYSGYDRDGYGIYLIENMRALQTTALLTSDALTPRRAREKTTARTPSAPLSNRQPYSRIPRQWLFVPTLLAEQLIPTYDESKGTTHIKGGLIVNFMDPLAWAGVGNEGGAFLLVDRNIINPVLNFLDKDREIAPFASYDAGAFVTSRMLPLTVDGELTLRTIAGRDMFYEESEGKDMSLLYSIRITNALLGASHPLHNGLWGQLFVGLDRYDVSLKDDFFPTFSYNMSKGYRAGAMAWFLAQARNSRSNISPTGFAGKLQYNLWQQHSLQEENSIKIEDGGIPKEQYDDYLFHLINGRMLLGMGSPLYPKHDIHLSLGGSYLKPIGNQDLPSFYLPAARVPGYAFLYWDEKIRVSESGDSTRTVQDTVLVTGRAVLSGQLSYRFPLWPGRIDRKLGFLYFDRLYGALNLNAGAGFDNPGDVFNFDRSDWLLAYGAELRLEALSFNNYPLSVKLRWDYGADRASPENFADNREVTLGGHRFAFSLGFRFDDWHTIPLIDYFTPARLGNSSGVRMSGRGNTRSAP
jgi:Tol biopolymer transport system component